TKKMSKSATQPQHAVYILDTAEEIRAKVMRATTDSLRDIRFDTDRPGIYNLLVIYELFTGYSRTDIVARFAGKGYAEFKRELARVIIAGLRPLQTRFREFATDPASLDALLLAGAEKVRPVAEATLTAAKHNMGLG